MVAGHPNDESHPACCYRHAPGNERLVVKRKTKEIQEKVELLGQEEKAIVHSIWSNFTRAPSTLRPLVLDGILQACCLPQLSHISTALYTLLRMDFIGDMPTEISVRILQYLDVQGLCHAVQVSKKWKNIADDDVVGTLLVLISDRVIYVSTIRGMKREVE
ncbi:hypothetical protein SeLEV6574_g07345 [Synchytrium endobioticum]|uniref:F-box domain-containing protein n=1 Tax=Synchytrium endobioticum TaxID=286115 RepID=A0A507CLW1_9FUNG|nr:hypothetical protein SeLEV6574_g07345 [Synchytrium endobioticum]